MSPRSGFLVGFEDDEPLTPSAPSAAVSDFAMAVSDIWKQRIQILPSATVKPMT